MKICMVAPLMNHTVGGGANIQLHKTAHFLKKSGIDIEFFDPWKQYTEGDVDLFHLFTANMSTLDLARKLRDFNLKFVVSPIFFTLHGPAFLKMAVSVEALVSVLFKGVWTDYGMVQQICRLSEAVFPNTTEEGRLITQGLKINDEKINVIPNGVDDHFRTGDPSLFISKYGIKDFILYTGMIGSVRKNTLSLIRSVQHMNVPLVLIGNVHHNDYGKKCLEEASKNNNILLLESLDHDDPMLASACAACHTFVLPSYFETPGISALEAALAGANIVITKYGGTKDYFADQAWYIEPSSVSSIRKGLAQSLIAPRKALLQQRIVDNYLWPGVAEKTAELYRRILNR